MILKLKTRDEFMAVWEALNQYIDNAVEIEEGAEQPAEVQAAERLRDEMDRYYIDAAENGGQRRLRALPSVKADASLFEKVTVEG